MFVGFGVWGFLYGNEGRGFERGGGCWIVRGVIWMLIAVGFLSWSYLRCNVWSSRLCDSRYEADTPLPVMRHAETSWPQHLRRGIVDGRTWDSS